MARASKVALSMRLEPEIALRVEALQRDDESKTQCYSRVLEAGVEALTVKPEPADTADAALVDTLTRYVDTLETQLHAKDSQIQELHSSLLAAQTLHQMAMQQKAIEGGTPEFEYDAPQEHAQDAAQAHNVAEPTPIYSTTTTQQPRRGGLLSRIFWGR